MLVKRLTYTIFLTAVALIIWRLLYLAQFEAYDDNIASLIIAFLISLLSFSILIFLWFRKRKAMLQFRFETMVFVIISSPLTVGLAIIYYFEIFGASLKN